MEVLQNIVGLIEADVNRAINSQSRVNQLTLALVLTYTYCMLDVVDGGKDIASFEVGEASARAQQLLGAAVASGDEGVLSTRAHLEYLLKRLLFQSSLSALTDTTAPVDEGTSYQVDVTLDRQNQWVRQLSDLELDIIRDAGKIRGLLLALIKAQYNRFTHVDLAWPEVQNSPFSEFLSVLNTVSRVKTLQLVPLVEYARAVGEACGVFYNDL